MKALVLAVALTATSPVAAIFCGGHVGAEGGAVTPASELHPLVERILRPAIAGEELEPTPEAIARLWDRMYSAMRVRGQTGGFMLDAISGVDLALWDGAGKCLHRPVGAMIGASRPSEG